MSKIVVRTNSPGALSRATLWAIKAAEARGDTVEVKTVEQMEAKRPPLVAVCDEWQSR